MSVLLNSIRYSFTSPNVISTSDSIVGHAPHRKSGLNALPGGNLNEDRHGHNTLRLKAIIELASGVPSKVAFFDSHSIARCHAHARRGHVGSAPGAMPTPVVGMWEVRTGRSQGHAIVALAPEMASASEKD
jgi:hypothetical protein